MSLVQDTLIYTPHKKKNYIDILTEMMAAVAVYIRKNSENENATIIQSDFYFIVYNLEKISQPSHHYSNTLVEEVWVH